MVRPDAMQVRDFLGYGERLPDPNWPGDAVIAVNFNLNVEGGGESTLYNGDPVSEGMLNDIGVPEFAGRRSPLVESVFEFGSRRGSWRVLDIMKQFSVPMSVLVVGRGAEQNPELAKAFADRGHEIVSHGYRWIDYGAVTPGVEAEHIQKAIDALTKTTGIRPTGWMTGRPGPNTRQLIAAAGFEYDRDALNDELPYWVEVDGKPHLVIPYSYETNDNRFNENSGFSTADDYFHYMRDAFDVMYSEGLKGQPKLLSFGLHDRLIGRPARSAGLTRLLEHMARHKRVWFCTGQDVANHWKTHFPAQQ